MCVLPARELFSKRSEVDKRAGSHSLLYSRVQYMCKSTGICDETRNILLNIFFPAHLQDLFLVVCSIYKRNLWLNMVRCAKVPVQQSRLEQHVPARGVLCANHFQCRTYVAQWSKTVEKFIEFGFTRILHKKFSGKKDSLRFEIV